MSDLADKLKAMAATADRDGRYGRARTIREAAERLRELERRVQVGNGMLENEIVDLREENERLRERLDLERKVTIDRGTYETLRMENERLSNRLRDAGLGGQGSHWEGCWKSHIDCARARVESLTEENERLREHPPRGGSA